MMVNKKQIIKETMDVVSDSILIGKITPEHFAMPVEHALDKYEEELSTSIRKWFEERYP